MASIAGKARQRSPGAQPRSQQLTIFVLVTSLIPSPQPKYHALNSSDLQLTKPDRKLAISSFSQPSDSSKPLNLSLNKKQQRFVNEYIVDLNATKAAIRAGYSQKTAAQLASRMLKVVKISAAIQRAMDKRAGRLQITQDNVLQELAKLAFLDARKFYGPDGSLIPVTELDDNTAACLQGIEIEEAYQHFGKGQAKATGVLKKIKFADKGINLERLGRHLKLFTDKLEVEVDGALWDRLQRAKARRKGQK